MLFEVAVPSGGYDPLRSFNLYHRLIIVRQVKYVYCSEILVHAE